MVQTTATLTELTDLPVTIGSVTRRVDPDAIANNDVDTAMTALAQSKRLIDGAITLMARRVAESKCHTGTGHRNAKDYLADKTGTSVGRAKGQLSASERITDQPETRDAVREGELSADQAAVVADAVDADPDAAAELLSSARNDSLVELRNKARNVKFDADGDPDRTRTRHHHRRSFRTWTESDGEWRASLSGPADIGARIEAALRGAHDRIFKSASAAGRRENDACYRFDALVATLEHGAYRPAGHAKPSHSQPPPADPDSAVPQPDPSDPTPPPNQSESTDPNRGQPQPNLARHANKPNAAGPKADADANPVNGQESRARGRPADIDSHRDVDSHGDLHDRDGPRNRPDDLPPHSSQQPPFHHPQRSPDHHDPPAPSDQPPGHRGDLSAPAAPSDQPPGRYGDLPAGGGPSATQPREPTTTATPVIDDAWQPYMPGVTGLATGRQTKVIIHVDGTALIRGRLEDGERCWIQGIGDVSLAAVKEQIASAHIAYVIRDAVDIRSVVHLGRQVTAHQRTALQARGYVCDVPGCATNHLLEIDHITGWTITHQTALDDLAWLCPHHHRQKTAGTHRLTGPPGKRKWTTGLDVVLAEDQPRHPETGAEPSERVSPNKACDPAPRQPSLL